MNRKALNFALYFGLNFSFISMYSCETIELSFVLSSIRLKSPSYCMAINVLDLKYYKANSLFEDAKDLASKVAQYPSNSICTIFRNVDLPLPASPYNTMNFCMFLESPDIILPIAH